jgi:hypothetical protein
MAVEPGQDRLTPRLRGQLLVLIEVPNGNTPSFGEGSGSTSRAQSTRSPLGSLRRFAHTAEFARSA